jgi:serine/threonine protein kinase/outer membrane protein assembly factor BamB
MLPLSAEDPRMIGEFHLRARLGAGGMGRVYLAASPGGRAVAVKVVHPHLARDGAFIGRFRREVAAAQAVNGGYATPVIAAGPDDNPPWLATAYVPGPSLQEAVTATGPLPDDAVLKLAAGLAEALRVIHHCSLVHRDLKPGNVLLAADGPRVIDFGIARALDGTALTSAESLLGTPSYMSPEQAQSQPAGPASDVFSLGGVLYFAATATSPFGIGHPAAMLYRIVHTEPDLDPVPPRLRDLIAACLAKDAARRPAPAELAAALMGAIPPGDSPAAFWPAPVARLIDAYQARLSGSPPEGPPSSAGPAPGPAPGPVTAPSVTPATVVQVPWNEETPPPGPASPRPLAKPEPAGPPMGRRRALAALAGMATGGLAVAGWELAHRGQPSAGQLEAARKPRGRPGARLWRFATNGPVEAVAVHGGTVYAGTGHNTVFALDAVTGRQRWRRTTTRQFNDQLAATQNAVFIADGSDGGAYALDAATGRQLWNQPTSGVLGLAVAGGLVYLGTAVKSDTTGGVSALAADGGGLQWTEEFGGVANTNGGLGMSGNAVYATTAGGEVLAYRASDGTRLWRIGNKNVQFGAAPIVTGAGRVYVSSSNSVPVVYAVQSGTGHAIWEHPLGTAQFPAYLTLAAGVVFAAVTRDDRLKGPAAGDLIALNAANGRQLWKTGVAGAVGLGPAVANGIVYTGSNNGVLDAWQAATGRYLWGYHAGDTIGTYVAAADGAVYFGTSDGHVYAVAAQ